MTRVARWAPLALASTFCISAAPAQERCLAAEYRLPASIADEMRPYLVCGMIRGDGHVGARLNGQPVSLRGDGIEGCGALRSRALEASERRLATAMPDAAARRNFIAAEFGNADRFLRAAARSEDLAVGEEPSAPRCRNDDARDR